MSGIRGRPLRIVVLISGRGSNLQSLIDACGDRLPARIVTVISNRPQARGLERARMAGIPTRVVDHRSYEDRQGFDQALREAIDGVEPDLVVLAGFMRVLTDAFTDHYTGRLLNIHPSLLPRHRGLHTHERVLEAREAESGASVHFVTSELDGGPVILQARVPVRDDDTPEVLAARVLDKEHIIYPLVIDWYAQGRLQLRDDTVYMDGHALAQPLQLEQILAERRHGEHAGNETS